MALSKTQYYVKSSDGEKRCVAYYDQGTTEIWDRTLISIKRMQGDQFEAFKQQTASQGFQQDKNPGWQAPPEP